MSNSFDIVLWLFSKLMLILLTVLYSDLWYLYHLMETWSQFKWIRDQYDLTEIQEELITTPKSWIERLYTLWNKRGLDDFYDVQTLMLKYHSLGTKTNVFEDWITSHHIGTHFWGGAVGAQTCAHSATVRKCWQVLSFCKVFSCCCWAQQKPECLSNHSFGSCEVRTVSVYLSWISSTSWRSQNIAAVEVYHFYCARDNV